MIYAASGFPTKFVEKFSKRILAEEYREYRKNRFGERVFLVRENERKKIVRSLEKNKDIVIPLKSGGSAKIQSRKLTFSY